MSLIFKKELKSYFSGMIGYTFIALMLFVVGLFSTQYNFTDGYPSFSIILYGVSFIFLAIIPMLTMKSFAGERTQKTVSLIYSLPIKLTSVVLGKYFAMLFVYFIAMLVMCVYPLILSSFGEVNYMLDYTNILAFFMLGAALISICMFISSVSSNQVIAVVSGFAVLLIIYLLPDIAAMFPATPFVSYMALVLLCLFIGVFIYLMTDHFYASVIPVLIAELVLSVLYFTGSDIFEGLFAGLLNKLSLFSLLTPFIEGLFDLGGIFTYLSVSFVFVFLSVVSLEKKRYN